MKEGMGVAKLTSLEGPSRRLKEHSDERVQTGGHMFRGEMRRTKILDLSEYRGVGDLASHD